MTPHAKAEALLFVRVATHVVLDCVSIRTLFELSWLCARSGPVGEGMLPVLSRLLSGPNPVRNEENSTAANALSERMRCQYRALSRLKDCEVIAFVDENAPEEPRGQVTVEPFGTHILSDASEAEEAHVA